MLKKLKVSIATLVFISGSIASFACQGTIYVCSGDVEDAIDQAWENCPQGSHFKIVPLNCN